MSVPVCFRSFGGQYTYTIPAGPPTVPAMTLEDRWGAFEKDGAVKFNANQDALAADASTQLKEIKQQQTVCVYQFIHQLKEGATSKIVDNLMLSSYKSSATVKNDNSAANALVFNAFREFLDTDLQISAALVKVGVEEGAFLAGYNDLKSKN